MHLKGLRTYLIGSIEAVSDNEAIAWRDEATLFLKKMGVIVFDPTRKNNMGGLQEVGKERALINNLKETGQWDEFRKRFRDIVHVDLRAVDHSDFIVAYMPNDIPMVGSIHEIVLARQQKKKVLVFTGKPKHMTNSWAAYIIHHDYIFETLEDIREYLLTQDNQSLTYNLLGQE